MPVNVIEYASILQNRLDQHIYNVATTGWMEANAGQVIYTGGKEIKIPTLTTQGLADYDRDKGFTQGSVSLKYKTYEMGQDRGRTFTLDSMDIDESNFMMTAANVMKEFQENHVIREIDGYRYSKLADIAEKANRSDDYKLDKDTALDKLREDIIKIQEEMGIAVPLVVTLSASALKVIEDSPKLNRNLNVGDFKNGQVDLKIKEIDGNFLRVAPQNVLKTKFKINDGKTSGQEVGGLADEDTAKNINWIIMPMKTPIAVSKTDKIRIFTPDINQNADAWKLDYRKYHELWVKESQLKTLWLSKAGA